MCRQLRARANGRRIALRWRHRRSPSSAIVWQFLQSTRAVSVGLTQPFPDRTARSPWEGYGRSVNLAELQDIIERTYGDRDRGRGVAPTVAWLAEEFGELAQAVRKGTPAQIEHEFSDVLAWVASLANQVGVDLTEVVDRYKDGCPKCSAAPCQC